MSIQISTISGTLDLSDGADLRAYKFDAEEIARALSKTCRFNGQLPGDFFYSVAEHSVLLSFLVPPEFAKHALLHDAAEAYVGDIIRPVKQALGEAIEAIERRILREILRQHNIAADLPDQVNWIDRWVAAVELETIWDAHRVALGKPPLRSKAPGLHLNCHDPAEAYALFLARYDELFEKPEPPQ